MGVLDGKITPAINHCRHAGQCNVLLTIGFPSVSNLVSILAPGSAKTSLFNWNRSRQIHNFNTECITEYSNSPQRHYKQNNHYQRKYCVTIIRPNFYKFVKTNTHFNIVLALLKKSYVVEGKVIKPGLPNVMF